MKRHRCARTPLLLATLSTSSLFLGACQVPKPSAETRFASASETMNVETSEDNITTAKIAHSLDDFSPQEHDEFCWAACIQTVLALQDNKGIPTQTELWEANTNSKLFHRDKVAATYEEIRLALAPDLRTKMQPYSVIDALHSTNASDLIQELAAGYPVIVGLRDDSDSKMGHAYVAYGLDYTDADKKGLSFTQITKTASAAVSKANNFLSGESTDNAEPIAPKNNYQATAIHLFDPYTDDTNTEGKHVTKDIETIIETLDFAISPRSARIYLADQLEWIKKFNEGPGIYVRDPWDREGRPLERFTTADAD